MTRVEADRDLAAALRGAATAVLDRGSPFWHEDDSVGDALFVRVRWDLQDVLDSSNVAWIDCVHYLRFWLPAHYIDLNPSRSFNSDNGLAKETVDNLHARARDSSCTEDFLAKRVHAIGVLLKIFPDYLERRGHPENRDSDPLAYWRTLRRDLLDEDVLLGRRRVCCEADASIYGKFRSDGAPRPARAPLLPVAGSRGSVDD